jgi:6-phosphogluconolactonase
VSGDATRAERERLGRSGEGAGAGDSTQGGVVGEDVSVLVDREAMSVRAAAAIGEAIGRARSERGVAHVALSGGGTPVRTYELLAERLSADRGAVEGLELWFADERCVGPEDPESNYKLVHDVLAAPAAISSSQVHRMEGELGPDEGARRYAELLGARVSADQAGREVPALDLAVLGIGPDGHTASLFPESPALLDTAGRLCLAVHDSPKPPPERITLSLAVLRAARLSLVLASGAEKATALRDALGAPSPAAPVSLLPRDRLRVLADADAGAELGSGTAAAAR